MRKDPTLVLSDTFLALREMYIRETGEPDDKREALFAEMLEAYEGFDIIEVICREAAVLTAYDWIGRPQRNAPLLDFEDYLKRIVEAAHKYIASTNWPQVETRRAAEFVAYARSL